jgi:hypothetical protein
MHIGPGRAFTPRTEADSCAKPLWHRAQDNQGLAALRTREPEAPKRIVEAPKKGPDRMATGQHKNISIMQMAGSRVKKLRENGRICRRSRSHVNKKKLRAVYGAHAVLHQGRLCTSKVPGWPSRTCIVRACCSVPPRAQKSEGSICRSAPAREATPP